MKPNLLFNPFYRVVGSILVLAGLILSYFYFFQKGAISFLQYGPPLDPHNIIHWPGQQNLTDEFAYTFLIVGLIFIGFSKLKDENELSGKLRSKALFWSVVVDVLFVSVFLIIQCIGELFKISVIQGSDIFFKIVPYNPFVFLFIFLLRFYYLLARVKNEGKTLCLLPHSPYSLIAKIGGVLLIILGILSNIQVFGHYLPSELLIPVPFLFLLWIWSRQKTEDKRVNNARLYAIQMAVYINYSLLLLAVWFTYDIDFIIVLYAGLISVQIIFILVFYYRLFKSRRETLFAGSVVTG